MEWCDIELLIHFCSQNTFLFGVKLSDYHSRMKSAASRSSAIINFNTITDASFFVLDAVGTKTGTKIWHQIYSAGFWSNEHVPGLKLHSYSHAIERPVAHISVLPIS